MMLGCQNFALFFFKILPPNHGHILVKNGIKIPIRFCPKVRGAGKAHVRLYFYDETLAFNSPFQTYYGDLNKLSPA